MSKPKHVLVLEDEPATLKMFEQMLVNAGYQVTPVRNGAEAIQAVNARMPDLVVSDLGVPGLDGYATIAMFRRMMNFDAPVIVVSGHARPTDKQKAFDAGADAFLAKPVMRDDLLAAVAKHLAPPEETPAAPEPSPEPNSTAE